MQSVALLYSGSMGWASLVKQGTSTPVSEATLTCLISDHQEACFVVLLAAEEFAERV